MIQFSTIKGMNVQSLGRLCLLYCFFMSTTLYAQRPTVDEVNTQQVFIEATKEKLLGNYKNAAFLFNEVLEKDTRNAAAAYELARVCDAMDMDEKALNNSRKSIEIAPKNVWYQSFYAEMLEKVGRYQEAADIYSAISKKRPENDYLPYMQAEMLLKAGKIKKAIVVFDEIEKRFGFNPDLLVKKFELYAQTNQKKKAITEIQKLIEAFPSDTRYMHLLADYYSELGADKYVNDIYKKILQINPKDSKAKLGLSKKAKEKNGDAAFLENLTLEFENPSTPIDFKVKAIMPYVFKMAEGKSSEATGQQLLSLAQTLSKVHEDEAKAHAVHADVLYYTGNTKKALVEYYKTLDLNNGIYAVWEQILYINAELGNAKELVKRSEEAMDIFPNKGRVYYLNGLGLFQEQKYTEAANSLMNAKMMSSRDENLRIDVALLTGRVYYQLKKYTRGNKAFEEAVTLAPKSPIVLSSYAYCLAEEGKELKKAVELSEQANKIAPNQPNVEDALGWVYFKMKDFKNAEKWIGKALKNGGDQSPLILEHYGDLLAEKGDLTNAVEYWKAAQSKGSNSPELDKKINTN